MQRALQCLGGGRRKEDRNIPHSGQEVHGGLSTVEIIEESLAALEGSEHDNHVEGLLLSQTYPNVILDVVSKKKKTGDERVSGMK